MTFQFFILKTKVKLLIFNIFFANFEQNEKMVKKLGLTIFILLSISNISFSQVILPDSITSTVGKFGFGCPCEVENLNLGITTGTTESTNFPFETSSSFSSNDIGHISSLGNDTLTLSFHYNSGYDITKLIVWNAYFTSELNHSIDSITLRFFNNLGHQITSINTTIPIADDSDESGYAFNLASPVIGVSRIELHVKTLHGGNEISLRRVAFEGIPSTSSVSESGYNYLNIYPNPAKDLIFIKTSISGSVTIFNQLGQQVYNSTTINNEVTILDTSPFGKGLYFIHLDTPTGRHTRKLVIE